jgi:hypothetical protein
MGTKSFDGLGLRLALLLDTSAPGHQYSRLLYERVTSVRLVSVFLQTRLPEYLEGASFLIMIALLTPVPFFL